MTESEKAAIKRRDYERRLEALPPKTREIVRYYVENLRPKRRRKYSDPSITKGEYKLNNMIARSNGGGRRLGDFVLNLTRRRGMSSQDLSKKRSPKDCAKDATKIA